MWPNVWPQHPIDEEPLVDQDATCGRVVLPGKVVLFGGRAGNSDTWEWDGNAWTQRNVTGPSGRTGSG
jgi:hypothetical protein